MGMQDRDWYREEMRSRKRAEDAAQQKKRRPFWRREKRIPVDLLDNTGPPKLWGADWHWSLQLLVWLAIAVLVLIACRLLQ
ncbi:hypothetical protein D9M72_614550 [compost metagenome]